MTGVEEAALAFEILSSGVSLVNQGDIKYTGPSAEVGVTVTNLPDNVRNALQTHTSHQEIFEYHSSAPAGEAVSVKVVCYAQYNGPEVQATFMFPSDGMRSRWGSDVSVTIGNPLSLDRHPAPDSWHRIGVPTFPVVRVPVSVFVDEPWPTDNTKVSFMLLLSGMYGIGAGGGSPYEDWQQTND